MLRSLRAVHIARAPRAVRGLVAPAYDRYVPYAPTSKWANARHASHDGPAFDAVLVGAGAAMFGTPEGPWNMSRRAELKLGPRLKVAAVIDPDTRRARRALAAKGDTFVAPSYAAAEALPSIEAYATRVRDGEAPVPKAIFVACPPQYRGGLEARNDLELQITRHFPDTAIMLEKPIATGLPWAESVGNAHEVGRVLESRHRGVVSIGYCLRYLAAVREMKKIIEDRGLNVMATFGRYIMAYELAVRKDWWRTSGSQGPIIENGSHLCDLSRYFGGEVDLESIAAHALEAHEGPGALSRLAFNDGAIPLEDKIPRVTSANWKYKSGAVGALLHGTVLHGAEYSIGLEVYCDGYQLILRDPFGTPSVAVREPGSDKLEVLSTPGDDPYTTEISDFIDAIEGKPTRILSSYADAARTYEFTWAVRRASEAVTRQRRAHECGETLIHGEGGTGLDELRMAHGA